MRSNKAIPLSSQPTASPSMMQERERRRANVSTIRGKRYVRSLPGGLERTFLASNDPKTVVLDLVYPQRHGRWFGGSGRKARRNETGGQNTHKHGRVIMVAAR